MTKVVTTQDGNHLVTDETGTVSFPTIDKAKAEIRRREMRQRSDGGLNIFTKHTQIQTGERA